MNHHLRVGSFICAQRPVRTHVLVGFGNLVAVAVEGCEWLGLGADGVIGTGGGWMSALHEPGDELSRLRPLQNATVIEELSQLILGGDDPLLSLGVWPRAHRSSRTAG